MTKKKYLTIIWSITFIVVLVAVIMHFVGVGFCGVSFSMGKSVHDEKSFGNKDIEVLVVDCDIADLDIEYGKELSVEYDCAEKLLPEVNYEAGKLSVVQKKDKEVFGIGSKNSFDYKITVTIPRDTVVKTMDITMDVGDLDIDEVNCEDITIKENVGDVSIDKMKANTTYFDLDVGDFTIKGGDIKKLNVNCDVGDIDIKGDFGKIDVSANIGDVDIETNGKVDRNNTYIKCDLGDVTVNGEKWKK